MPPKTGTFCVWMGPTAKRPPRVLVGFLLCVAVTLMLACAQLVVVRNECRSSAVIQLHSARHGRALGEWRLSSGGATIAILSTIGDHDDLRSVIAEVDGERIGGQRYYHAALLKPFYSVQLGEEHGVCVAALGR